MPIHSDPTKMEEGELIYALDIGTRSVIGMLEPWSRDGYAY